MKKLILFLMLLPLIGVSQTPKYIDLIGHKTTKTPILNKYKHEPLEMYVFDTTFVNTTFIPIYRSEKDNKNIVVNFKNGEYGNFDHAVITLPKDTACAIIELIKHCIKLEYELDSVKKEAYKDMIRRHDEYVKVIKFLKDSK